jgi:NitT/TauT family transport system substrate-binding protein
VNAVSKTLLLLGTFALATGESSIPVLAQDQVRVGLAAINPAHTPLNLAIQKGWFQEAGLRVEATIFRGGGAAQEALAAGAVDIVHQVPTTVALAQKKGVKQRCVFSIGTSDGWHMIVLPNSNFKSMKDLAGKNIGITTKGATSDMFALWALKNAGVTGRTVTLGAVPSMMAALNSKQIEAATINPTPSYRVLATGEGVSIFDFGKSMPRTPSCYVASQELMERNPASLRRFLAAISTSIKYMQAHEAESIDEIKKYTKDGDHIVAKAAFDTNIKTMDPYGIATDQDVQASLDLNVLAGLGTVDWPIREIYTNDFTPPKL